MRQGQFLKNTDGLWGAAFFIPILVILVAYIVSPFSWGLMDDLSLLSISGNWWERVSHCFMVYFQFGELKWTHAIYCGTFYNLFSSSPQAFYIFKAALIVAMLASWGLVAWHLTQRRVSFFILGVVALSFHYLYDQFYFLSTHETTGLLFLGLALWMISRAEIPPIKWHARVMAWLLGVVFLLLSLGAKETFLAGLAATGAALLIYGSMDSNKRFLVFKGAAIVVVSIAYGLFLKFVVSSGYTSEYSFTNTSRIIENFQAWVKRDFVVHVPWLLVSGGVLAFTGGWVRWKKLKEGERFGFLLAIFLYGAFLFILLPWNSVSYYAGPLGVFFGLLVTMALAPRIEQLSLKKQFLLVIFAAIFAMAMGIYTLSRESGYNRDTQRLWQWIKNDAEFRVADNSGKVFCNGAEASVAIAGHADRFWHLGLKPFIFEGKGFLAARDKGADYYVFSKRFGMINQSDLKGWKVVFYSLWWQVYQKDSIR